MDYLNIGFVMGSGIMQVIVFSLIPFLCWLIKYKKQDNFFKWIGLYKPVKLVSNKKATIGMVIYFAVFILSYIISKEVSSNFENMGAVGIVPSLIVCFIQNGLSEEILFRGFIGKRLIAKFGKVSGILMQAVLFGFMHIALALAMNLPINISLMVSYFIIPTIAGWMLGYIDEKIYNGSIIPSIVLHGIVNFTRDLMLMF